MKIKDKKKFWGNILYPVASVVLVFLVWQIAATAVGSELILPSPAASFGEFFRILGTGSFYGALFSTFLRGLVCFGIAAGIAAVLAVVSFLVKPVYRILDPIVSVLRAVPTMSVIILFWICTTTQRAPSYVAMLIVFPMLFTGFYSALSGVDEKLLEMAKVYCVPRKKRVFQLYLRGAAEPTFDLLRSTIGLNYKVMIAAEVMVSTKNSIGTFMKQAQVELNIPLLFAYTLAAVILGVVMENAVRLVKYFVVRWNRV